MIPVSCSLMRMMVPTPFVFRLIQMPVWRMSPLPFLTVLPFGWMPMIPAMLLVIGKTKVEGIEMLQPLEAQSWFPMASMLYPSCDTAEIMPQPGGIITILEKLVMFVRFSGFGKIREVITLCLGIAIMPIFIETPICSILNGHPIR